MLRGMLAAVVVLIALLVASGARATALDPAAADPTPPRLSHATGSVSFWRPGGDEWAPAQVNTPLADGDELYTARDGNLELQVGPRAFVRAWGDTQLGLVEQEPSFLQFRVASGHVALDLRTLEAGDTVELATPAAAFTIDRPGYYRVDVTAERTSFSARRSGRAGVTTASGPAPAIEAGEAVVIEAGVVQRLAAPDLDVWDRWNEARSASLVAPVSARYVPEQVYGVTELERYGAWRSDSAYGSVWVPARVAPDWAPYTTGRWIWDPRFGWTWLDDAPWGWAPYHYGRWVSLGGVWAWAPGPIVVRPAYAPALVAFFGTPTVGVHVAGPSIGWVALGWGEPVVPWWGRPHFVGHPWWGGWGGPRVTHVTVHRNVTIANAVVVVRSDHFGRRRVHEARLARPDIRGLQPVRGRLDVRPEPASFRGRDGHAQRPPEGQVSRRVVSTRPPVQRPDPFRERDDRREARPDDRPDGGRGQRPEPTRPVAPRVEPRRSDTPRVTPPRPQAPRADAPRPETPRVAPPRPEAPRVVAPRPETPRVTPPRPQAPRVDAPPQPQAPRVVGPRPETPRVTPPRPQAPRVDAPPQPQAPRVVGPRPETPRVTPPRPQAPRVDAPPQPQAPRVDAPPRPQAPRAGAPRPETPRVEPGRPEVPRGEPRSDIRRPEPRVDAPGLQTPRRAGASDDERRSRAPRPAVRRPEANPRATGRPTDPEGRPGRSGQQDRRGQWR